MTELKVRVEIGSSHGDTVEVGEAAKNAVLFDFNTTGSIDVAVVKALYAAAIQKMKDIQASPKSSPAMKRMAAIAITQTELTQMPAVKAYFAKD